MGFCDGLRGRSFAAVFVYLRAIAGLSAAIVCYFAPPIGRPVELRGFLRASSAEEMRWKSNGRSEVRFAIGRHGARA
jgi:hypothetical protein